MMNLLVRAFLCLLSLFVAMNLHADMVMPMTTIENPGNSPDWTGMGGVSYTYQISTYEVTVSQYTEFLNAVAASDPNGLYNDSMATGPLGSFIARSGTDGSYTYSVTPGTENEPVRNVSFYDGIRLANWLANGQGDGDTETGSYTLADGITLTRNANATWVVPSEDEWYKAAYYDPETDSYHMYPNGSDDAPAEPTDETTTRDMNFGGPPFWQGDQYYTAIGETTGHSPYGVYDMGGNVQEWTDTMVLPANRITRGGELFDPETALRTTSQQPYDPTTEGDLQGLRLAYIIPEPSTVALFLLGALGGAFGWLRRKR
jgi:formylglycine-generating enzyme required for sulfatase activity